MDMPGNAQKPRTTNKVIKQKVFNQNHLNKYLTNRLGLYFLIISKLM